jgi:hypothetical protein
MSRDRPVIEAISSPSAELPSRTRSQAADALIAGTYLSGMNDAVDRLLESKPDGMWARN